VPGRDLGTALDWAAGRAAAKGFAGVTVACEPIGHRWRELGQLAAERGMPFSCAANGRSPRGKSDGDQRAEVDSWFDPGSEASGAEL